MSIKDIVAVNITRETPVLTQAGFGTLMILDNHKLFNERIRFYNSMDELSGDGFGENSAVYLSASLVFSQNPRVVSIAVGRRSADVATITIGDVVTGAAYEVTCQGNTFTHTASGGQTATQIATALFNLMDNNIDGVTVSDNQDGSVEFSADVAGTPYTLTAGDNITVSSPSSDTVVNDMDAVIDVSDDFYGVMLTSRDEAEVLSMAAYIETKVKLFGTTSLDPTIPTNATSDLASKLKDFNYTRTFLLYHEAALATYPEAAWFGRQLPTAPGATTWAFKTLVGMTTHTLTSTMRAFVLNKNANTYEDRGGASITREGKVVSGEFIDVIRGLDWLQARLTERVLNTLVNTPKIPYTDAGVGVIEADVRAVLDLATTQGVINNDPAYTVTVPLVRTISALDKANRFLPDVKFSATLSGAIHSTVINGLISL